MSLDNPQTGFRINGWHVLAMFVVFFGAVSVVDGMMVVRAYRTFPGEVADNPYEDGLAYDSTLGRKAAQAALGWKMTAGLVSPRLIRLTVAGPTAAPIAGLRVQGKLERPATETGLQTLIFKETAPGVYDAATPAFSGAWDLSIVAYDHQGRRFDAARRLVSP